MIEIEITRVFKFESRSSVQRMVGNSSDTRLVAKLNDWLQRNPESKTLRELEVDVVVSTLGGVSTATASYEGVSYLERDDRPDRALDALLNNVVIL